MTRRFPTADLLDLAAQIDRGFDPGAFAQMLGHLDRFTDEELPVAASETAALRTFFQRWRQQLTGRQSD